MTSRSSDGMLDALRGAIERHQLRMLYQPQISLADGRLLRVEALMRWDDAALGPVQPSVFIPLAEEHGLIDELTQWGLRTILKQWLEWRDSGVQTGIALNISALSLQHLDFPDLVERMCRALEVPADCLLLELTEGATQPLIKLMDTLTRFRIKGIGLAIDDFGTGYSSLMLLRQLPFTEVKIDQAFVGDLTTSRDCRQIVQAIAGLAHGLSLSATAEGIETEEQLQILREIGCDVGQGYLISRPLEAAELRSWAEEFRGRWATLIGADESRLRRNVEADALGER